MEAYYARLASGLAQNGGRLVLVLEEASDDVIRRFEDAGACFEAVDSLGGGPLGLSGWRQLAAIVRRERPNAAIMHFFPLVHPTSFLLKSLGVSRVIYVDDHSGPADENSRPRSLVKRAVLRQLIRPIDGAIGVSQYVTRRLRSATGFPDELVRCVYNGVAVERGRVKNVSGELEQLGIGANDFVCLVVASMIPEKGMYVAVDAFADKPELGHLILIGDGPQRAEIEAQAQSQSHIHVLGLRSDVYDWMARSNALIVPSMWHEAFGLAIAEAMVNGIPVLASRVGAIPELVLDGKTGLLFEAGNSSELATLVAQLKGDPNYCQTLGTQGEERGKDLLSVDRMVDQVLEFVTTC